MIGILIFPDFQLLDAAGPISVFEVGARYSGKPPAIRVLALNAGPVRSSSGVEMMAGDLKSAKAITTLVVAGGEGVGVRAATDAGGHVAKRRDVRSLDADRLAQHVRLLAR